jgi:hypothetical protein
LQRISEEREKEMALFQNLGDASGSADGDDGVDGREAGVGKSASDVAAAVRSFVSKVSGFEGVDSVAGVAQHNMSAAGDRARMQTQTLTRTDTRSADVDVDADAGVGISMVKFVD